MQSKDLKNLDRLKEWIREKDEKELKYVEPRILSKDLGITVNEADELLSQLVKNNEATRYFIFKCPSETCAEEIVIDYEELNEKAECEICGKVFIPNNMTQNSINIFYEVVKEKGNENSHDEVDFFSKYLGKKNKKEDLDDSKVLTVFPKKNDDECTAMNNNDENKSNMRKSIDRSKIFIVHGRDEVAKTEVARYVESFGLKAIILNEQASQGKTIIEKIEKYSDVGFAIVLYTPCDIGGLKGEENNLSPRARQNVIFEHGYLIGKIGRENVCALVKENVEKPNDISGVVYITMDSGKGWMMELAKELKASEYDIDMNKLFNQ